MEQLIVYQDTGGALVYTVTINKANSQDNFSAVTMLHIRQFQCSDCNTHHRAFQSCSGRCKYGLEIIVTVTTRQPSRIRTSISLIFKPTWAPGHATVSLIVHTPRKLINAAVIIRCWRWLQGYCGSTTGVRAGHESLPSCAQRPRSRCSIRRSPAIPELHHNLQWICDIQHHVPDHRWFQYCAEWIQRTHLSEPFISATTNFISADAELT